MIFHRVRAADLTDLLIPVAAGVLAATTQRLQDRADRAEAVLGRLRAEVNHRHDQLAGVEHLCTPVPEAEPEPDKAATKPGRQWPIVVLAAVAIAWKFGRPLLGQALDKVEANRVTDQRIEDQAADRAAQAFRGELHPKAGQLCKCGAPYGDDGNCTQRLAEENGTDLDEEGPQ